MYNIIYLAKVKREVRCPVCQSVYAPAIEICYLQIITCELHALICRVWLSTCRHRIPVISCCRTVFCTCLVNNRSWTPALAATQPIRLHTDAMLYPWFRWQYPLCWYSRADQGSERMSISQLGNKWSDPRRLSSKQCPNCDPVCVHRWIDTNNGIQCLPSIPIMPCGMSFCRCISRYLLCRAHIAAQVSRPHLTMTPIYRCSWTANTSDWMLSCEMF